MMRSSRHGLTWPVSRLVTAPVTCTSACRSARLRLLSLLVYISRHLARLFVPFTSAHVNNRLPA